VMVQCVVQHELSGDNAPFTLGIPVTTLCQEFVDEIAVFLSCSANTLSVYYERHSLLDSVDKVYAFCVLWSYLFNRVLDCARI